METPAFKSPALKPCVVQEERKEDRVGGGPGHGSATRATSYIDPLPYPADVALTSNVLTPSPDKNYSYAVKAFLIPHEALRVEMFRLERAVAVMDVVSAPWKVAYLARWYNDFFLHTLHEHHDVEGT